MRIPKLRFKEFSGEWEEKRLGDICKFINGKGHEQFIKEDGKYIVVNSKFISTNGVVKKYTSNLLVPLYINDILMVMSDVPNGKAIGKCFFVEKNDTYSLNQRICAIRTKENSKYLYYYLNRNTYFLKFDDGISQTNLKKEEVLACPIFLSCPEEQRKVADFLSSIDKKIAIAEEKLNLFKDYKKGMMQKIFKQEIRFKDENSNDYPDWEEKRLGDIAKIVMGQSPSSSNYNEEFKGLPLIQGNADCNNRKIFPRMYTTEITKESFPNDIIMTVRAPVGAVSLSEIHSCIGRGVCAIRNANKYLYHYLIKLEDSWDKIAQGSTFTAINSNDIKNLIINLPCLEEQEKIANFLSSIDNKIENLSNELEKLKEFKKGLLQKMFI